MLKIISVTALSTIFGSRLWFHKSSNLKAESKFQEECKTDHEEANSRCEHSCHRIAIIGSGIGGCSTAYFLRQLLPNANIDVYEKSDSVGGRLSVVKVGNNDFEAGGSIIHNKNQYLVSFMKETGLQPFFKADKKFGIYNGSQFVFEESANKVLNLLKLIWRYGPYTLYKMNAVVNHTLQQFDNIYNLQNQQNSYSTVEDLLIALGGKTFLQYTKETLEDVMLKEGVSKTLINELITAAVRVNYGQNINVTAFAGLVALAGIQGGSLFAIKGGNYQVCKKLLLLTNSNLMLNHCISSIHKSYDKSTENIYYNLECQDYEISKVKYDCVIIAAPLEGSKSFLKCKKCLSWPNTQESYQSIVATFVQGCLKYEAFKCKSESKMPCFILTTEAPNLKYTSIGLQTDVFGTEPKENVYKIFSHQKLTDADLKACFHVDDSSFPVSVEWSAYPQYKVPETFAPFKLDDGIFYVNAIEKAASAMEMSAISGRNAAILTKKYLEKMVK